MLASLDLLMSPVGLAQWDLLRLLRHRDPQGARFAKVLLPIRLRSMPLPVPRLRCFGFFAVWDEEADLARFRAAAFPARESTRHLALDLAPIGAHGSWHDGDPLGGQRGPSDDGPVLLLTHSRTRPTKMARFMLADGPVVRSLSGPAGPLWADGFMDGVLTLDTGTLSIWPSLDEATRFAYADGVHREAVAAQRAGGWFAESWFGRFAIAEARGSWPGLDLPASL